MKMTEVNEEKKTDLIPRKVKITQMLFYVNGVIWLALAGFAFFKDGGLQGGYWIIALMMVGNGAVLIALGLGLVKYPKLLFRLGLLVVVVNILLTFTDQFGFFDIATLVIDLALFNMLMLNRRYYVS